MSQLVWLKVSLFLSFLLIVGDLHSFIYFFMKSNENFEASAFVKYVRVSPFKVRRVLDQIRGRSSKEAMIILKFMPYRSSPIILKVLKSALANSSNLYKIDSDLLYVTEATVDSGPMLKRFCPHAQGRGFPIKKRTCHIIITV
jgi:large subunit ribosomal protein L22